MKSAIVSAFILAFLSANLAGAAPQSGGQPVQGSPQVQGGLQPQAGSQPQGGQQLQAGKPVEPAVQAMGPPQKIEQYQQLTKKKMQHPGDKINGMSNAGLPLGADTKETTVISLYPLKPTKPNPLPDVWRRRQCAKELVLNQAARIHMQVVLRQEARLASEVALHQEVRMSPEVEVALRQEVRMALLVVLSKGTREGRMLD
ncbi:hypothetical protein OAory_01039420 [Aspergillus oryzae]|uniref:Uncharacterized protein n=1 Tax=Aspergillus oryzae TaxID=5062 RepID=A0A1S9DEC5_ASPOZ|nr:uncharacterized protein G4B84_012158 [Aspergillus flavus NRRL3357]KAF7626297.1 hypothetical protein AFLA_013691 [Aspergillus flavus NRRL3357]OOO07442.1 hypothetical protein OAory_01039420 [Aspergillus oryzae]QMW36629.1 hypothetical protein G4B84_012158 [Aspergillus flavus NRRL3357]QMW48685.1 hypothetical protein G4B11_012203 [Aspergillus flavus]